MKRILTAWALAGHLRRLGRADESIDAYVDAEAAFEGEQVDGAARRELYRERNGSLDGRLAAARVDAPAPDWELKDLDGVGAVEGAADAASWDKIIQAFVRDNTYTFTVVNDLGAAVNAAYGVESLPSVFVVERRG
jgi:hypothetical protein